jgi:hypothetical protein
LFDDDIAVSLPIYIDAVSKRTGEVFTETLLRDEGILVDRVVEFIKYPSVQVTEGLRKVAKAQQTMMRSGARLQQLLRKRAEDAAPNEFMDTQIAEAEAILADAEAKFRHARQEEATLNSRRLDLETKHEELKQRLIEASDELARVRATKAAAALGTTKEKLVQLSIEEQDLVSLMYRLLDETGGAKAAYDSALNASVGIVKLEDMILAEFGSSEKFKRFVEIFGDYNQSLTQGEEDAITNYIRNVFGEDVDELLAEVQAMGQVEIDRLLDAGRKIVTELDDSGTGSWIGVTLAQNDELPANSLKQIEAALDVLRDQVVNNGEEFVWWMKLLEDLNPDAYKKFRDESGMRTQGVVTPDDLVQAKAKINKAINTDQMEFAIGNYKKPSITQLAKTDPELKEAIRIWYGSVPAREHVASSIITDGDNLDKLIHAVQTEIETNLKVRRHLLQNVRDITFSIPHNGEVVQIGWDDYVNLVTYREHSINALYKSQNTAGVPAKFPNADDLVDGPHEVVILGVGGGNRQNTKSADFIFSAQNLGLDPNTVTDSGRNWVTKAYTQMVVSPHAPKGGSNAGVLIKVPRTAADPLHGEGFYYYIKSYTDDSGFDLHEANGVRLVGADSGRVRASGEVVANALYRAFGDMGVTRTGTAPVGSVSRMNSTRLGLTAQGEYMLTTDYMDNVISSINASTTGGVANQSRVKLKSGGYTLAYKVNNTWMGLIDGELVDVQNLIDFSNTRNIVSVDELIQEQMLVDIITSNWDALGNAGDNIGINNVTGEVIRLDNGGSFHYSAMGGSKERTYGWDWREVSEIVNEGGVIGQGSFFDTVNPNINTDPAKKTSVYAKIRDRLNAQDGGGFEGMVADQLQKLLRIRSRNGGWDGFVANALGTGDEVINADAALLAEFLEVRTRKLAEVFNIPVPEGEELVLQGLVEAGLKPEDAQQALQIGFDPVTQSFSEALGLRPWLSSADEILRDGVDQRSQWIVALVEGQRSARRWVAKAAKKKPSEVKVNSSFEAATSSANVEVKGAAEQQLEYLPFSDNFDEGFLFKDEVEDIYELNDIPDEDWSDLFVEGTSSTIDDDTILEIPNYEIDPEIPINAQMIDGINDENGDILQYAFDAIDHNAATAGETNEFKAQLYEFISEVVDEPDVYKALATEDDDIITEVMEDLAFDVFEDDADLQFYYDYIQPVLADMGLLYKKEALHPWEKVRGVALDEAIERAPFAARKDKFTVLVYDRNGNAIARVPVGSDEVTGVAGDLASFEGMNLLGAVKQAAREQLGGDIVLHGALSDDIVKSTAGLDEESHYFIAKIMDSGGIEVGADGPRSLSRDNRLVDNVLNVVHGTSNASGVMDAFSTVGTLSSKWVDTAGLNGSPLALIYHMTGKGKAYSMRINMSQNVARNAKIYGVAPHTKGLYGESLSKWNAIDPTNPVLKGNLDAPKQEVYQLVDEAVEMIQEIHGTTEGLIKDALGTSTHEEWITDYGMNDMILDMWQKAHDSDGSFFDEIIDMLKGYEVGGVTEVSIKQGVVVFDGIRNLTRNFDSFAELSWRERLTFLGWLNTNQGIPKATGFPETMVQRTKKWAQISSNTRVSDRQLAMNDLLTLDETEMDALVAEFLADVSQSGAPDGQYFVNRIVAEAAPAVNAISSVNRLNHAGYGDTNILSQWLSDTKIIADDYDLPEIATSVKKAHTSAGSSKRKLLLTQALTEGKKVKSLGSAADLNLAPARYRQLVRLQQKFREVWRRSLSAEGHDIALWLNAKDAFSNNVPGHDAFGQFLNPAPNYMITNPRAIAYDVIPNSVTPTSVKGKVAGQIVSGSGEETLLNPELFIKEYETMLDDLIETPPEPDIADIDLLQQVQEKRAEIVKSIYKTEDSIARAGARIDSFHAKTDLWALEAEETAAKKVLETAQAASIAAHIKAQQFIKAEQTLNRLGAGVDANGNEIPADQLADDLRNLRFAVDILGEADAEAMRMTANALEEGVVGADALSTLSPVGDDKFFFPLTRTQNFEEVMESVWQSGFKPIGSHTQGPKEIVEAMTAVTRFRSQGGFGAFLKHYDKLHNLLKGYMILKPGFHMRNYFSGVFMNYLHGVDISSYRQFQRAYWKFQHDEALRMGLDKRAGDIKKAMGVRKIWGKVSEDHVDIIRQMSEGNILGGSQGQVAGEFGVSPIVGGRRINFSAINPLDSRNAPLRLSRNIGVGTETFIRGVMGFDVLKKGGMVDEAFDTVVKFHFDYDDLSDFERSFVKRLVPFYTWTKKNLPLMLEQIGRNPAKMTAYLKAKKEIERGQEKPAVIPDYFIRQGGIQLPFKYKGENMFVLPDLPFKSPIEMIDPALQFRTDLSVAERARLAIGTLGTMTTPIVKAPYEWNAKQNLWKGYTFDGRYQQVPTVFYKTPLLMPMMQAVGLATKENDIWMMRDHDLHAMAQMLPTFSDMRRLFPSEERYQQRTLSTWMSFVFGLGLRTNTKEEQERTVRAKFFEMQDEMRDMRSLQQAAEGDQ